MDLGLDDYWLKVAMEKAGEIYGSPMCADALRADASARRDIILHERANSLAEQLKWSEEAAHAAATAAYFASPDVIIAEFTGDKSSGQGPTPKSLNKPTSTRSSSQRKDFGATVLDLGVLHQHDSRISNEERGQNQVKTHAPRTIPLVIPYTCIHNANPFSVLSFFTR